MSTKSSLAYGDTVVASTRNESDERNLGFHLYQECFDEDNVYLELEGVEYEATLERVMVTIPIAIWETIRKYTILDLSYADKSDEEIQAMAEEAVNERVKKYNNCDDERQRNLIAVIGAIPYGLASAPRDEQIEHGKQYFRDKRERQLAIKDTIEALKKLNSKQANS